MACVTVLVMEAMRVVCDVRPEAEEIVDLHVAIQTEVLAEADETTDNQNRTVEK